MYFWKMQKQTYQQRIEEYSALLAANKKSRLAVGTLRLVVFVFTLLTIYWYASQSQPLWLIGLFSGMAAFFILVKRAGKLEATKQLNQTLRSINEKEIKALEGNWISESEGEEFKEPQHPFALDFDLFGKRSLFAWINRSYNWLGQKTLANWLKHPSLESETILNRQEAVSELSHRLDFRQKLAAFGQLKSSGEEELNQTIEWLKSDGFIQKQSFWRILRWILPSSMVLVTTLYIADVITTQYFTYALVGSFLITGSFIKKINREYLQASKSLETLQLYKSFFELLDQEDFTSSLLKNKREKLVSKEGALGHIQSLTKIIEAFDNRNNMIMGVILNLLLFWDINCLWNIAQWKNQNKSDFQSWFADLGEIEALCSLANIQYNHQKWTFPSPEKNQYRFELKEMGHPFIADEVRVNNSYSIIELGSFSIVTGANMAGKSTFLRSLGVNLVLAMIGSVVCAQDMKFTPVQLFSSMRTEDSLQDQASYFFSELSRLKDLVTRLENGVPTFIVLDEILKGTNSKDKAMGSKAFVKNIVHKNAIGAIATHDLSLCELEKELPTKITNYSFEVMFEKDDLRFDYTLRRGICQNMNASFLMKKMGIIPDEIH